MHTYMLSTRACVGYLTFQNHGTCTRIDRFMPTYLTHHHAMIRTQMNTSIYTIMCTHIRVVISYVSIKKHVYMNTYMCVCVHLTYQH